MGLGYCDLGPERENDKREEREEKEVNRKEEERRSVGLEVVTMAPSTIHYANA